MKDSKQFQEVLNPPNPWHESHVQWLEEIPPSKPRLYAEPARSILSRNESPDIPFQWSVNPYRGCSHACAYCYARPTHEYLGLGAGVDFDSVLFYKPDAPELLQEAFAKNTWVGERVVFSGVTDPYQPIEASLELTRKCLEVCEACANPVTVITKGALVERDLELLVRIHQKADVLLVLSIPFLNGAMARKVEAGAPSPRRRLQVIARAARAGIPVGVAISPLIPGLNDMEIPGILRGARQAGARYAMCSLLRLPGNAASVFRQRIRKEFPERAARIDSQLNACRSGQQNPSQFGERMKGQGARWEIIRRLFERVRQQEGYERWEGVEAGPHFIRPSRGGQLRLF